MNWKAKPPYQQLFILSIGIMIFYLLMSRVLGVFIDESEVPFRKILRFTMGLAFVGSVIWVYILPQRNKK